MKCPFELPVRKAHLAKTPFVEDIKGTAFCKCDDEETADYIVLAINSYEKLVNVCRNASASLAITMLPRLDNNVASDNDIIKIVILSLEQALKEAGETK